jgi:hypothetical protein
MSGSSMFSPRSEAPAAGQSALFTSVAATLRGAMSVVPYGRANITSGADTRLNFAGAAAGLWVLPAGWIFDIYYLAWHAPVIGTSAATGKLWAGLVSGAIAGLVDVSASFGSMSIAVGTDAVTVTLPTTAPYQVDATAAAKWIVPSVTTAATNTVTCSIGGNLYKP